jgi:hypothetical protein
VLYEGRAIAFGSCEEIFARVRKVGNQPPPAGQASVKAGGERARGAAVAESV